MESDAVAEEQPHITLLYQQLDAMRRYSAGRLKEVLLNTGGTPQARSERESFTQMYTEDIARFDAAEHGLCFGRIDLADGDSHEVRYVGRLGILDEDNDYETLLLDWRAPMARPFYLATTATPEGVTRRRHIRSRGRKVTTVNDEYLDLDAAVAAGRTSVDSSVGTESALLAALNAARTGQMTDIVATIQSEQDAIIRSEHRSVLVVQGGPGTGKTAVALHRAAYLLYTYRQQLDKSGVLIIGPNPTFLNYIAAVLPSLGETGVLLSTIGNLYPGVEATVTDSLAAQELKGSLSMVEVMKAAVRDRQSVPDQPLTIRFEGHDLRVDRRLAARARGRARSSRRPHNLARPIFIAALLDGLVDQTARAMGADLLTHDDLADIRSGIREESSFGAVTDQLWPELTAEEVLRELWGSASRIATATPTLSPESRKALLRTESGFSAADAPLLDEVAELLGIDDSHQRAREERQWRKQIEYAQEALDILTGSASQDVTDEIDPELLMAFDVLDAEQLAERQKYRVHRTTAERAAGDRSWTYGHVIVDEAQELSEMAWRMVMRRSPNRWMTVVGDVAQTGDPAGTSAWSDVLSPYVANRWLKRELTVNYRAPGQIMRVAADVLRSIDPTAVAPQSVRDTTLAPKALPCGAATRHETVRKALAEFDSGTAAVICPKSLRGDFADLVDERTSVLTVIDSKGLEFDTVVVVEPADIIAESPRGMNDLYVAITRTTQALTIVFSSELPRELRRVNDQDVDA